MAPELLETFERLETSSISLTQAVRAVNIGAGEQVLTYDKARMAFMNGKIDCGKLESGRINLNREQFEQLIDAYAPDLKLAA